MNSVTAVVVTYNRLAMLQKCIAALIRQTFPCDILVIDNASDDGTRQWVSQLAARTPQLHYCNTGENLGGAGGFHFGMRRAVENGCGFVWAMDDDCIPTPTALEALMQAHALLRGDYGWLSSKCLWTNGSLCPMNLQRASPYREIACLGDGVVPAQMASFVSLFLSADTIRQFGLPIREFFIWTDDWEFTRRISRSRSCYAVSGSVVIHAMKNNTVVNIAADTPERIPRYHYFYRNDVYLYRREGLFGWLWLLAKDCWHSAQVLKTGIDCRRKLKIIWKGFAEGLRFLPGIDYIE